MSSYDFTTLYYPETDAEVPVRVDYDIDGYRDITVTAVYADMPGELGPDISGDLTDEQIADLADAICDRISWRSPRESFSPYYVADHRSL